MYEIGCSDIREELIAIKKCVQLLQSYSLRLFWLPMGQTALMVR